MQTEMVAEKCNSVLMDDHQTLVRDQVREMLDLTGLNPTELARKAGLSHTTLTRFLHSDVNHVLSSKTLFKLEQVLRSHAIKSKVQSRHLDAKKEASQPSSRAPAKMTTGSIIAQRLKAARRAYWPDINEAARTLNISVDQLRGWEDETFPVPADFVLRFCCQTGCPREWVLDGELKGADPKLAAWIAHLAPELLPDLLSGQGLGEAEGEESA